MTNLATTDSLDSLKKVDKLWFEDADVVFCAGQYKFRVYRGILCAQSMIFRDMFAMPQGEGGEKGNISMRTGKSLDVVTLPDDPNDIHRFFLALFDPSYYHPPPSKTSREATVSILRLAHKYDVPYLIRHAVAHLDAFYPLDKERLLSVSQQVRNNAAPNTHISLLGGLLDTIPLAGSIDCEWIIPSVLYTMVSQYDISEIMAHPSFARLASTSQIHIVQFSIQYGTAYDHRYDWISAVPWPTGRCATRAHCEALSKCMHNQLRQDQKRLAVGLTESSFDIKIDGNPNLAFCQQCQSSGRTYQKKMDAGYWNKYPVVCGFQNWDVLKIMRDKCLQEKEDAFKVASD